MVSIRLFSLSSEDIRIVGRIEPYALPPDLVSTIQAVQESERHSQLVDVISKTVERKQLAISNVEVSNLASSLVETFGHAWGNYNVQKYDGFVYITIENKGVKTSENMVFDLPLSGVALITNQDGSQQVIEFSKKIELENLRSKNTINIAIWTTSRVSLFNTEGFKLTHKNGVEEVSFGETVYGMPRKLAAVFAKPILLLIGSCLVIVWVMILVGSYAFFKNRPDRVSPPSNHVGRKETDEKDEKKKPSEDKTTG